MDLLSYARSQKDPVRPEGVVDVLLFYAIVARRLRKFLAGKEIASRIWLPSSGRGYVIKRGSDIGPLYAGELAEAVTPELLALRREGDLAGAGRDLTDVQKKAWSYFVPRRLCDFFYATNGEGPGKPIERIFFDLDRGEGISAEEAASAAEAFTRIIMEDAALEELIGPPQPFVYWTGRSFHVLLLLDKPREASFYDRYFRYSKASPGDSFTGRWAKELGDTLGFPISGGHEKKPGVLTVDPSQTPSGKLCRVPLGSLHMRDASTVDGVSIPVSGSILHKKGLAERLERYSPSDVLTNLEQHCKDLPDKYYIN